MVIEITYDPAWRAPAWDETVPSRPAWFIHCEEHGQLSKGWGFTEGWRAQASATRHQNAYHKGQPVTVVKWKDLLDKATRDA